MVTFIPTTEFGIPLSRAREDVTSWKHCKVPTKNGHSPDVESTTLKKMMRDPDATRTSLGSPDAKTRLAAVALVIEHWLGHQQFTSDALRLAFEDPDPAIRGGALTSLAMLAKYIQDPTGFLRRLLDELFPTSPSDTAARRNWIEDELARGRIEYRQRWLALAGEDASRILENRHTAESFLDDAQPRVRMAALLAIKHEWKPDKDFEHQCERLLAEDTDVDVRALALSCLAGCYLHTNDEHVGKLAARFVYDDACPIRLRRAAYSALFKIRGMPPRLVLEATSPQCPFPEDVDWEFVDSFLKGSK